MTQSAIRLNWNPQLAPEDITAEHVEAFERDGVIRLFWRCGQTQLEVGQRAFLIRTGRGPRGVIGMGRIVSEPEDGFTDEDGDWIPYAVLVDFEIFSMMPLVQRDALDIPPLDAVPWSNAAAAVKVPSDAADYLLSSI